ncbi:hypothetical protein ACL58G_14625 [Massilia sp. GER05]|uniref:hypothetical protein n=1 Tax=Massilia sp. GER05 TaxID=3394605 RepID=UPI003F8362AD
MYTAYVAATPNGRKLIIALEEPGLDYRGHHVACDEPGIAPRDYLHVDAWLRRIAERPAVARAASKMRKA